MQVGGTPVALFLALASVLHLAFASHSALASPHIVPQGSDFQLGHHHPRRRVEAQY